MLKLFLVLAIIVGILAFANVEVVHYSGAGDWSFDRTITIKILVAQWLDVEMLWLSGLTIAVLDYDEWYPNRLGYHVGNLKIKSNANVYVEATMTYLEGVSASPGLEFSIYPNTLLLSAWSNHPESNNFAVYPFTVRVKAAKSTPAGIYKYLLTIKLRPTVTFN